MEGTVKNIRMLTTALVTPDNKLIVLPNSNIVTNEDRQLQRPGTAPRGSDVFRGVRIRSETGLRHYFGGDPLGRQDARRPRSHRPSGEHGGLCHRYFRPLLCDAEDYWDIYYYILDKVFNEFKKNGISVPFQQMEVRMREDAPANFFDASPLPARVEKVRPEQEEEDFIDRMRLTMSRRGTPPREKREKGGRKRGCRKAR